MNDINPKNYKGATTFIVGNAGGEPQRKDFAGGNSITELSVAVPQGYKNKSDEWVDTGTTWYTVTAWADHAADHWPEVAKGDKVRVDNARQETHEFTRKDGTTGLQITLKFGELSVVERKADREPATAGAKSSDTPW